MTKPEYRVGRAAGGLLGLLVLSAAGACTPTTPIDAQKTTGTAAVNAGDTISRAGRALGFALAGDGTLSKAASSSTTTAGDVVNPTMTTTVTTMTSALTAAATGPATGPTLPASMLKAMVGPALTAQVTGAAMPSMMTTEEKFDQVADEVRRAMEERLFVPANLEGTSGDTATYWLKADPTCRPLPHDSDPPGTLPDVGAKCSDELGKVEVRIAVNDDGDGARLRVLIGPQRLELVTFIVHSDLLSAEYDLAMVQAASTYIHTQLGDDSPVESFDRLSGKWKVSLKKVGGQAVTAALSITQALDVAVTGGSEMTSAAADPVFAITGDGVSKTGEIQLGLGATEVAGTWDPRHTGAKNRDLRETIGGIFGKISLDENARKLVLSDVGMGEMKIAVRGTPVFDLNLNADSMRRFSGVVTVNADDTDHLEVTPKVDVSVALDYQSIASDFTTPPSETVLHDTYGVALTNGGAPFVVETVKSTATFKGGLRVVAGTLSLSATSAPDQTVTVPSGKCLSSPGAAPAGKNPLLGALFVSDCP